jgi:nucleotide-binding universal stress UspA family protein
MKKLLVPVDFSCGADLVIEKAKQISKAFGSEVRIINIVPPLPLEIRNRLEVNSVSTMGDMVGRLIGSNTYDDIRDDMARSLKSIHKKILEAKKKFVAEGIIAEAYIFEGKMEESILEEASEYQPDMIIMSSQGHGYRFKSMVGGIYSTIIKNVSCPVMVVPSGKSPAKKNKTVQV